MKLEDVETIFEDIISRKNQKDATGFYALSIKGENAFIVRIGLREEKIIKSEAYLIQKITFEEMP